MPNHLVILAWQFMTAMYAGTLASETGDSLPVAGLVIAIGGMCVTGIEIILFRKHIRSRRAGDMGVVDTP